MDTCAAKGHVGRENPRPWLCFLETHSPTQTRNLCPPRGGARRRSALISLKCPQKVWWMLDMFIS